MEQAKGLRRPSDLGLMAFIDRYGNWITSCDPNIPLRQAMNAVADGQVLMFRRCDCASVTHELVDKDKLSLFEVSIKGSLDDSNLIVSRSGEQFSDVFFREIEDGTGAGLPAAAPSSVAQARADTAPEECSPSGNGPAPRLHPEELWSKAEERVIVFIARRSKPRDVIGYINLLVESASEVDSGHTPDAFEAACWLFVRRPIVWASYSNKAPSVIPSDYLLDVMSKAGGVVDAFPPLPGNGPPLKYTWPDSFQSVSLELEDNGLPPSVAGFGRQLVQLAMYRKSPGILVPAEDGPSAQDAAENWLKKNKKFICGKIDENQRLLKR